MARTVQGGSLGARLLALLGERYPITLREAAIALGARPDTLAREARKLVASGLIVLETLGDETYAALAGPGWTYLGLPPREAARLKERRPPPGRPRDEDDPAFG